MSRPNVYEEKVLRRRIERWRRSGHTLNSCQRSVSTREDKEKVGHYAVNLSFSNGKFKDSEVQIAIDVRAVHGKTKGQEACICTEKMKYVVQVQERKRMCKIQP